MAESYSSLFCDKCGKEVSKDPVKLNEHLKSEGLDHGTFSMKVYDGRGRLLKIMKLEMG